MKSVDIAVSLAPQSIIEKYKTTILITLELKEKN